MKIISYNMLHDKKSKQNWTVILDNYNPDIILAQESLAPDEYRMPLLEEDGWQGQATWSPVNATTDFQRECLYTRSRLKSGTPRR